MNCNIRIYKEVSVTRINIDGYVVTAETNSGEIIQWHILETPAAIISYLVT